MVAALPFFYVSLVLNIFLVLITIWLITRFQELSEAYHALRESKERGEKVAEKWLDEARTKSQQIVTEAEAKAAELITDAEVFNEGMIKKVDESLSNLTQEVGREVGKQLNSEVSIVATKLSQEALESFESAKNQIDEYKKLEFGKIDQEVRQMVHDISLEVLGKALDRADQEELVRKALEKLPKANDQSRS
jgi:vacuolar-type H+-ATPase subunit H